MNITSRVKNLASAAEYYFKIGLEGKSFRPTVAGLLHDVLDDAETRRGIDSLNFVMGNKVLVSTFNRAPNDLYDSGLQRDTFLPFIATLKVPLRANGWAYFPFGELCDTPLGATDYFDLFGN